MAIPVGQPILAQTADRRPSESLEDKSALGRQWRALVTAWDSVNFPPILSASAHKSSRAIPLQWCSWLMTTAICLCAWSKNVCNCGFPNELIIKMLAVLRGLGFLCLRVAKDEESHALASSARKLQATRALSPVALCPAAAEL